MSNIKHKILKYLVLPALGFVFAIGFYQTVLAASFN